MWEAIIIHVCFLCIRYITNMPVFMVSASGNSWLQALRESVTIWLICHIAYTFTPYVHLAGLNLMFPLHHPPLCTLSCYKSHVQLPLSPPILYVHCHGVMLNIVWRLIFVVHCGWVLKAMSFLNKCVQFKSQLGRIYYAIVWDSLSAFASVKSSE